MEEWSVPGTDSENEESPEKSASYVEFGGIRIPPSRLLELMQNVHQRKTMELDSLSEIQRKKKHKKKKKKKKSTIGVGGERTLEEASETASEIRSTTCTSTTATECRDMRRPNIHKFFDDPELDDARFAVSKPVMSTRIKKMPPHNHKREKQLARLDKITADEFKRKQRWQKTQRQSPPNPPNISSLPINHLDGIEQETKLPNTMKQLTHVQPFLNNGERMLVAEDSMEEVNDEEMKTRKAAALFFEEEESEKESSSSDSDMKLSLFSQINKVEQLLDSEGLS